jgi:hydrogenase nickel incorporation protein HypB
MLRRAIMSELKTFSIQKNIHEDNIKVANETRDFLKSQSTFMINVMSSPGSGKTTTLSQTIKVLKDAMKIGVIEADVDSDVDARTIQEAGGKAVQMHTGGLCHLDATMTRAGIDALEVKDLDLVFLENIGNLICTVGYDTGAMKNIGILSVPEGDDKPLKYPMIFAKVDALLISKMDVIDYFDFDMEKLEKRVKALNKDIKIFPISAKTGQGMESWISWLKDAMKGSNHG